MNLQEAAEFVNRAQNVMDKFFRRDPIDVAKAEARKAVDEFNSWVDAGNAEFAEARATLDRARTPLDELAKRISSLDGELRAKPNPQDALAVEAYNRVVGQVNGLVDERKRLLDAYERDREAYNRRFQVWESEYRQRKERLSDVESAAQKAISEYRDWIEEDGPEQFFAEVNRFYSAVKAFAASAAKPHSEMELYIRAAQDLRRELGLYAVNEENGREDGILIIAAELGDQKEPCFLIVDNAASSVSLNPELVQVLGWSGYVGPEVKIKLGGGYKTTGRFLPIPCMEVAGMKAEAVRGLMLEESHVGVDGCLGLSFLNRFDFRIERGKPHRLVLKKIAGVRPMFDVFICHKSEDIEYAQQVYDCLTAAGYQTFLSSITLQEMKLVEYPKEIDAAIEATSHMVVVSSHPKHLEATWVASEYQLFVALLRANKKKGNLLSVIFGEAMSPEDLPIALFNRQAIVTRTTPNWRQVLKGYLPAVEANSSKASASTNQAVYKRTT